MNSTQRFNRDEISKILKRAAELEHKDDVKDDSEGLTVEELQQVSKEVGLHPKYIQQALDELKNPEQSLSSNIFGGPFSYQQTKSVSGIIKENEWEEIVAEIRRIHGGIGKTSKLGNTFEWEQRKKEVGYIQISLSPKKDRTEISINANYKYFAYVVSILSGVASIPLFMFLANEFNSLPFSELIIFGPILALLVGARFYLSHWMNKKRKIYEKLFKRFKNMLGTDMETVQAPSIHIQEADARDTQKQSMNKGRNKKQTK